LAQVVWADERAHARLVNERLLRFPTTTAASRNSRSKPTLMPNHDEPNCGATGKSLQVETMSAGRAALGQGALWQNGRFNSRYDEVGHCLGSGGMGSVWAARVSDAPVSNSAKSPRRSAGTWVAVKAIPIELFDEDERAAESLHAGLRECLSTFRDLSPVHVVRYDNFWLEDPSFLPTGMRALCMKRGWNPDAAQNSVQSPTTHGASWNENSRQGFCEANGENSKRFDSTQSLRFRDIDENEMCAVLSGSRIPLTPVSANAESCGFVFEAAEDSISFHNKTRSMQFGSEENLLEAQARKPSQTNQTKAPSSCVALLIEMELMGPPPSGEKLPGDENRLTLREWLQRSTRTFSSAADVFGSLMMSVRHIHRKRLIHSDLKPDNIFITEKKDGTRVTAVRIGDFGLAGENMLGRTSTKKVLTGGTLGYMAPELLKKRCVAPTEKNDIFACAVILLELLLPPLRTHMERVEEVCNFTLGKALPAFIRMRLPKTRALLHEMGEEDPKMRLSAEEVLKKFDKEVRKELVRQPMQDCAMARTVSYGMMDKRDASPRSKSEHKQGSRAAKAPISPRVENPQRNAAPKKAKRRQKG